MFDQIILDGLKNKQSFNSSSIRIRISKLIWETFCWINTSQIKTLKIKINKVLVYPINDQIGDDKC